jgi:hypothetical protein
MGAHTYGGAGGLHASANSLTDHSGCRGTWAAGIAVPVDPTAPPTGCPPSAVVTIGSPLDSASQGQSDQVNFDEWMTEIRDYLRDNIFLEPDEATKWIVHLAKRYTLVEGDLYRHGTNGVLMHCITQGQGHELLTDNHGGECEWHSLSRMLVDKTFWYGFSWPTTLQDAVELVRRCETCQFHSM